jgi:hypothetical protein
MALEVSAPGRQAHVSEPIMKQYIMAELHGRVELFNSC